MNTLLSVEEVSKQYSSHRALYNVSITVPQGSVYGLLGPNGAGKTSLIRIINQITGPDSGRILFKNQLLNPDHTRFIGYLPEERGLYKKMEVGEQAIYLARLKGLSRNDAVKRLQYWFEKLEIKSWWRKKIEELSKGMQQKVQFIVTVIHEPELLILDEPFTGFDPINAGIIKDELLAMKDKGVTIVLSTHRMESVEELCSHIALINKSEKLLEGTVRDIRRANRTHLYEIEYTGNNIALANSLWGGYELVKNFQAGEHMHAVIKLNPDTDTNQLLQSMINNVTVLGFKEIIPSMNDIFIRTVNPETTILSNA